MADSLPLLGIETFKEIHGYGVTHDSNTPLRRRVRYNRLVR